MIACTRGASSGRQRRSSSRAPVELQVVEFDAAEPAHGKQRARAVRTPQAGRFGVTATHRL